MTDLTPETLAEQAVELAARLSEMTRAHDEMITAYHAVCAALTAEKAAREEAEQLIPRYAMLDVWCALYGPETANLFESFCDEHGYAETWSRLMSEVRGEKARADKAEQERDEALESVSDLCQRLDEAEESEREVAKSLRRSMEQAHGAAEEAEARAAELEAGIEKAAANADLLGMKSTAGILRALAEKGD